jgi:hypothetical protein
MHYRKKSETSIFALSLNAAAALTNKGLCNLKKEERILGTYSFAVSITDL